MTVKFRQSSIELLRIIAMIMVLVCHIDFHATGCPAFSDIIEFPTENITRILFSSLSKSCVIVFVLISGWFSIRFSFKGLSAFIFQCVYFALGSYIVMRTTGMISDSPMTFLRCFWFGDSCWFEKSYFALYLLAPVLNKYIEHADKRGFSIVLFSFLGFLILYGLTGSTAYINHGYSAFAFIGIYLLGSYSKRYLINGIRHPGTIFIICTVFNIILYILLSKYRFEELSMSYVNPIVIIQGVCLVIWFNKLNISYNRHINNIAQSAFAVYLFHTAPALWTPLFIPWSINISTNYSGIAYLAMVIVTILTIFLAALIFDLPRRIIWTKFLSRRLVPSSLTDTVSI